MSCCEYKSIQILLAWFSLDESYTNINKYNGNICFVSLWHFLQCRLHNFLKDKNKVKQNKTIKVKHSLVPMKLKKKKSNVILKH